MKSCLIRFLFAFIFALMLFVFSNQAYAQDKVEKKYLAIREAYLDFVKTGKPKLKNRRDLWMKHINAFKSITRKYPNHKRADDALYWVGDAYRNMYEVSRVKSDLRLAVATYEKLIKLYPKSRLADDASFFMGAIYEEKLSEPAKAYAAYARCCKFKNSDMASKAVVGKTRLAKYAPKPTPTPTPVPTPGPASDEFPVDLLGRGTVTKIDVWSNPDYTRIVIYTDRPVDFAPHLLPADPDHNKPRRLFIDIDKTVCTPNLAHNIPIGDGLLKQVRTGQFKEDVVRVVLDIQSIENHRVFPMFEPHRIVIDVTGTKGIKPTAAKGRISRIVIDPGHGGKDPGALSGGSKEKHLVLTISRKVAGELRGLGFEVIMTRKKDRYITLEGRTALANKLKADLFISIHVNSSRNKSAMGIEVFHFSPRVKKEDLEIVALENKTATAHVEHLDEILAGLEMGYRKIESNALAANILREIIGQLKPYREVKNRGVKSAPFYVLMGANMPAVLVECGFVSNKTERKRLNYSRYQDRIAKGIARGVVAYVKELNQDWKPKSAKAGKGKTNKSKPSKGKSKIAPFENHPEKIFESVWDG